MLHISIVGCGWLGLPVGRELVGRGHRVRGSTTTEAKFSVLAQAGVEPCLLSLIPQPVGALDAVLAAEVVLIAVPPRAGRFGDAFHPQQIYALTDALRLAQAVRRVIYVSSTSVYPELNREMVETDVTGPEQAAAPALAEAEQLVLSLAPRQSITVLRCGGLMGYDRIPGKYVAGKTVNTGAVPVNYIHRDDAVAAIVRLIEAPRSGVFNLVAPQHPTREAVYRRSCADFGYELPTFVESDAPVPYKQISPAKFVAQTGFQFAYPDPLDFQYG
jgi:nucleoside-diphosphate-sugar epimerase